MNGFKVEITSVPDRENLVAEIWFEDNLIAEINKENKSFLEIEVYPANKLKFSLKDCMYALEAARNELA